MITVIYNDADGEVVSVAHGIKPDDIPGCSTIMVDRSSVDPRHHKVVAGELIEKTAQEQAAALRPDPRQIAARVAAELHYSDRFMMPDYPVDDATRLAWVGYRRVLRDLSKGAATVEEMVAGFPSRPESQSR